MMDQDDADLLQYFNITPELFPWRGPVPGQIEIRRSLLSDLLFFDILLVSGGIRDPVPLYPPVDVPSLLQLLQAIENSTYDTLKKDCLVYFLLKWHQDGRETKFADERCIPPQFSALSDAYWHLDTGDNLSLAVSILSDARLNRDYSSKILDVISLSSNPTPLILRYVRTSKPLLSEPDDIDKYAMALAETSFTEAWQFQRTFSEDSETRSRLLQKLLHWCLSPKARSQPLKQLLAHPISAYEQSMLHSYALNVPSNVPAASIPVIHDLVCVRLINSGQFAAAIKLDRQFTVTGSRITEKSHKSSQDRRQMMEEILAVMPSVERQLLELELSNIAQGKNSGPSDMWGGMGSNAINDLNTSWEHLRPKDPSVFPRNGPFPNPPISERVGAPRFGGSALSRSASDVSYNANVVSTVFPPPATNQPPVPPLKVSAVTPVEPVGLSRPTGFRTNAAEPKTTFNSANQAPNAFYNPPSISATLKRPFVPEPIHDDAPADAGSESVPVEDVQMHTEDEQEAPAASTSRIEDPPQSQFAFSVFSASSSTNGAKNSTSLSTSKVDTKSKMPPGAFAEESEDEQEPASNGRFSLSVSPPPSRPHSPPPPPRATRAHATPNGKGKLALSQSIPGALFDGDAEEEEDIVAPLPSPRKTARKSRVAPKQNKDEEEPREKPIRRSSRLSTASSRGSPSPEPQVSPQKAKVRKSVRAVGSKKKRA